MASTWRSLNAVEWDNLWLRVDIQGIITASVPFGTLFRSVGGNYVISGAGTGEKRLQSIDNTGIANRNFEWINWR